MSTTQLIEQLRQLGPDQIRTRLTELAAEEKALKTLLKAAVAIERVREAHGEVPLRV